MDDHVILPDSSTKDTAGLFSWSTLSTCRKKIDSHRIEISHDEFAIEWACIMCGKTYMINNVFGIHMMKAHSHCREQNVSRELGGLCTASS